MSDDQTPERLRAFRERFSEQEEERNRNRVQRNTLVCVVIAVVAVLAAGQYARTATKPVAPGLDSANVGGLAPEDTRRVAAYLAQKGMNVAALDAYDDYLAKAPLTHDERAKVLFASAEIAIEDNAHERALAYLYQAETIAPTSELFSEIDDAIALCLDKLGRASDLRRELRDRTVDQRESELAPADDSLVLAEIGDEVITTHDVELAIAQLPAAAQAKFADPQAKRDLLNSLVAERAMLGRALRLKLDEDPEVLDQLEQMRDRIVVRKLMRDEMGDAADVTDADVKRYYDMNKGQFAVPARAFVRIARGADMEKALVATAGAPVTLVDGGGWPSDLPFPDEVWTELFLKKTGEQIGPFEIEDGWARIEIEKMEPMRTIPYEQAKSRAHQALLAEREQAAYSALVKETIERQDVRVYPERLTGTVTP